MRVILPLQSREERLIVTITNVEATDDAVTNDLISTNNSLSGVYENKNARTPFAVFKQPQTQLSQQGICS